MEVAVAALLDIEPGSVDNYTVFGISFISSRQLSSS